jgi:hypothetical protein
MGENVTVVNESNVADQGMSPSDRAKVAFASPNSVPPINDLPLAFLSAHCELFCPRLFCGMATLAMTAKATQAAINLATNYFIGPPINGRRKLPNRDGMDNGKAGAAKPKRGCLRKPVTQVTEETNLFL